MNRVIEILARCTGRIPDVRRDAPQQGDMRDTFADTARARADLAFMPRVPLEDGIHAEYQWLATSLSVAP